MALASAYDQWAYTISLAQNRVQDTQEDERAFALSGLISETAAFYTGRCPVLMLTPASGLILIEPGCIRYHEWWSLFQG
jgi:hypothetical protein